MDREKIIKIPEKHKGSTILERLLNIRKTIEQVLNLWEINDEHFNIFDAIFPMEEYKCCLKQNIINHQCKPNNFMPNSVKNIEKSHKKKIVQKNQIYTKEDAENFYREISQYFDTQNRDPENEMLKIDLLRNNYENIEENTEQILNIFAINRLSAIAKMKQFCKDCGVEMRKFGEIRVQQKIRGWHKMHKITAGKFSVDPIFNNEDSMWVCEFLDNEGICYPLIDELEYLLTLDIDNLETEFKILKNLILNPTKKYPTSELEQEFSRVSTRNSEIRNKIFDRLLVEKTELLMRPYLVQIEKKYDEIIPAMKRKHDKILKKEEKSLANSLAPKLKFKSMRKHTINSETAQDEQNACK